MTHLIDKDALVAEIEKCIYRCNEKKRSCPVNTQVEAICDNKINAYNKVLSSLNTLKVKEVDLKKEVKEYMDNEMKFLSDEVGYDTLLTIAKHFFELGLKAQKDNIWHTVDETPNYPCDILFLTNVDNMFLYRYMENGRPVDRETPYFNTILNGKCWCYCNDIVNK